jgi:ABC-type antimicrobial peptide transport system permease subunit
VPLIESFTLEQEVQSSLWQERLLTILSGFFGVIALVLSALGLYGALAYSVTRRSRELGIRIVVGAQMRDVVRAVCSRMLWPVLIGLLAGMFGASVLLGFAKTLLFGVARVDPLSFGAATILLLAASVAAAVPPSWRAAKTDPVVTLRVE